MTKRNKWVVTEDKKKFLRLGWHRFKPLEEVLAHFDSFEFVAADLETPSPPSAAIVKPFSLQLGEPENAFVIDLESVPLENLKDILTKKTLIFQNGVFDLPFLFAQGIIPKYIYDTLVAEKVLTLGIKNINRGLGDLVDRYVGITLDKSKQKTISQGFTDYESVDYAANDVLYLHEIKAAQEKLIQQRRLHKKLELENKVVHPFAYLDFCGIHLDTDEWMRRVRRIEYEEWGTMLELTKFAVETYPKLLDTDSDDPINWDSTKQVTAFFKAVGVDIVDEKTGKDSIAYKNIVREQDKFPIVKKYLDYKKKSKAVSTYGRNWFEYIQEDGRIHTKYNTLVSTGRTSSGATSMGPFPNAQNVGAKDARDRKCFKGQASNHLIALDFSGQESVIMADRSREPKLLKFYNEGLADLHWFTAQQIWTELDGVEYDEDNPEHKDKRQRAKMTNFAISYGGNGSTVATNMGIPEEEGIRIFEAYLAAFPKLSEYFDEQEKLAMERGYVLINEVTGGKRYIEGFNEYQEQQKRFTKAFWAEYRREKEKNSEKFQKTLFPLVSSNAKNKQRIRKMALNTPCQGTGADMAKEAGLRIWEWIIENKRFGKVKMVNFVHDEWIIEAHMRVCPKIAPELQKLMEDTANKYLEVLTMEAEPKISKHWVK